MDRDASTGWLRVVFGELINYAALLVLIHFVLQNGLFGPVLFFGSL